MYCGDGDIRIIDYQPATKKLIFDIDINNIKMGWRWVMEEEDTILWSLPGQVTCNTELTISSSPTKIKHQERLGIWRDHKQSFPLQITHNLWHAGWREAFGSHLGQSPAQSRTTANARSGQPLPYRIGRSFHTSGWSAPVLYFWLNEILLLIITLNLPGLQLMAINLCFVIFHCWEEFDSSVLVSSPLSSSCRLQLGPGPLPLPSNRSITDSILRLFSPW